MKEEILLWMTDIRDAYILDAMDRIPEMRKKSKKGEVFMYIGAGTAAAAVVAAVMTGSFLWSNQHGNSVKEPETLEETTQEATESVLGIGENERIVIPVSDERELVVDRNLNITDIVPKVRHYNSFLSDTAQSIDIIGELEEERINRFIVSEDELLVCGNAGLGLYSLAEHGWVTAPEYSSLYPIKDSRYLAEKWNEDGSLDCQHILASDGSILYESEKYVRVRGSSYMETVDEAGVYYADQILDLEGNTVYDFESEGVILLGINGDVAFFVRDSADFGRGVFLDLTSGVILAELDYDIGIHDTVAFDDYWFSKNDWFGVSTYEGNQCIFDVQAKRIITTESFYSQNRLEMPEQGKIWLSAYNTETDELLVSDNISWLRDDKEGKYYVCDRDWNIKTAYEGIFSGYGAYGIQKNENGCTLINFWTGEKQKMMIDLQAGNYINMIAPADGWFLFKGTDETGACCDTVVYKGQILEEGVSWEEVHEEVIELTKNQEKIFYTLDGKKLNSYIVPEEICYISADEIAVLREDIVFTDWDGNELGRIKIPDEMTEEKE